MAMGIPPSFQVRVSPAMSHHSLSCTVGEKNPPAISMVAYAVPKSTGIAPLCFVTIRITWCELIFPFLLAGDDSVPLLLSQALLGAKVDRCCPYWWFTSRTIVRLGSSWSSSSSSQVWRQKIHNQPADIWDAEIMFSSRFRAAPLATTSLSTPSLRTGSPGETWGEFCHAEKNHPKMEVDNFELCKTLDIQWFSSP